jgi:hypothetical protein
MNCRFHGHAHGAAFPTLGNQCGAIFEAHAPCKLELAGAAPDEQACDLAQRLIGAAVRTPAGAIQPGDRVHVESAMHRAIAEVLAIASADAPPCVPGFGPDQVNQVKHILTGWRWSHFMMLAYDLEMADDSIERVCFVAILTPRGWRDLLGQELSILPITEAER